MRSADEAVAYAKALHSLVVWLGVCDGNMQEGSFRIDANVSVRPVGQKEFGTRTETKNVNSFRFLERAIQYEIRRQIEVIEDGGKIIQETRLYDPDKDETRSMRTKEDAHDYRYFPDPDLPPLAISEEWIERVRSEMPELPPAKRARFVADFGISAYDAAQLTGTRATAEYFEAVVAQLPPGQAKIAANWVMGEVAAALNRDSLAIEQSPVSVAQLAKLLTRIADGTISNKIAREVFTALWSGEASDADAVIESRGLKQVSDSGAIGKLIDEVMEANAGIVAEFRAGKEKAFNSLVGQVMKAGRGKVNPQQVNDLLRQKLG
jgi:aspartyl-tRNA(Asn)/glutamyl-tRNA(Gln) amidotransferase subunit B